MMKLHPRHAVVTVASIDIQAALTEAIARHELTHAELTGILAQQLVQWNKYAIRDERAEPEEEHVESEVDRVRAECRAEIQAIEERCREELRRDAEMPEHFQIQRRMDGKDSYMQSVLDVQRMRGISSKLMRIVVA